jgi:hypothetical protein
MTIARRRRCSVDKRPDLRRMIEAKYKFEPSFKVAVGAQSDSIGFLKHETIITLKPMIGE